MRRPRPTRRRPIGRPCDDARRRHRLLRSRRDRARSPRRRAFARRPHPRHAGPHRRPRRCAARLRAGDGRERAGRSRHSRTGDRGRTHPRTAPRRPARRQGPLLDGGCPDGGRHGDPPQLSCARGRHRGGAVAGGRGRDPRQARHDGGSLRGLPSRHDGADQSLGRRGLAGHLLVGLRRRHRGGALLRVDRLGHRRGRSASLRPPTASPASSRPGVASAATAPSSSAPRSTISGPCAARPRTPPPC